MSASTDIAIVGAGPSGLAAAQQLRNSGLHLTVIDEQPRPGGQFLRQPPTHYRISDWLKGRLYRSAKEMLADVAGNERIEWCFNSTVLGIFPVSRSDEHGFDLHLQTEVGMSSLRAHRIILASGCREAPLPFPGWTLPGVMGAGAIQTLLKSQQVLAGERIVLAGSHPLQLIVADQILKAGGNVAAVLFAQPWTAIFRFLRSPVLAFQNWPQLLEVGRILSRLKMAGVPILFSRAPRKAGGGQRIERLVTNPVNASGQFINGQERSWETDCVGVCFGFQVSSELARQSGCETFWSPLEGGWLVRHDAWMKSTVPGIYAVGELTGQWGADAAMEKGRIASIGILAETGHLTSDAARANVRGPLARLKAQEDFARTLNKVAAPPTDLALNLLNGDTVICRCEEITLAQFDERLAGTSPIQSADAAKLMTRAGMGLCQGRTCYPSVACRLGQKGAGRIEDLGPFHATFPIKPVPIIDFLKK